MTSTHRDGPMNYDQRWKAHRLHVAGWAPDYIARMFGRTEDEIQAAIDACNQTLSATPADNGKAA